MMFALKDNSSGVDTSADYLLIQYKYIPVIPGSGCSVMLKRINSLLMFTAGLCNSYQFQQPAN